LLIPAVTVTGMSRSLLLGSLLIALTASAAVPVAPLQPRIGPLPYDQVDPAAATNGTTTLVAWTSAFSAYPQAHTIYARLLGVHASAVDIGPGVHPVVAWNGSEYLIANGIAGSRFSHPPFPNVAVTIVRADGTVGPRRLINTSTSTGATALAWNGTEWVVGIVSEGAGRVVLLDRDLNIVRAIELGEASNVGLTTIEGRVWVVHQRSDDSEVFRIGDEATRFRVAGHARMAGTLAIIEETLFASVLDPRSGFSAPRPILATSEIPLNLVHLAPYGSGALLVVYSVLGKTILLVPVDATGARIDFRPALTGYGILPGAAVAGSTLFIQAVTDTQATLQIFAFPLEPLPSVPFTPTNDAIVSLGDFARQNDAIIASNGASAVAFWNQTIDGTGNQAAFTRAVDANGIPYGPVTQLPFAIGRDTDVVLDGERFVLVWTTPYSEVYASTGGAPVLLGHGTGPAVARGTHGTFVVWRGLDGVVTGTPLRDDGTPHVPNGFPILPSLTVPQSDPDIIAVEQGFNVLWSAEEVTSVIVSPAGTPQASSGLADGVNGKVLMAGTLAAWPRMLAGFGGGGTSPEQRYAPPWGDDWAPVAIHAMDGGRHLVTIRRGDTLSTSVVTVADGHIVSVTPLRLLGDYDIGENGVTVVGDRPLVIFSTGRVVEVATQPVKRRAAR
jgi:hypothetical protein